jgi:type VI secretion system protein ImpE
VSAHADSRLGPVLEGMVEGKLFWIPFDRIRSIRIEPPTDLRDIVWTPAQFVWTNGGDAAGLVPTRYPGSERSEDNAVRLSRKTTWIESGPDTHHGSGQRSFATDASEYGLLDLREVVLETSDEPAAAERGDG